MVDFFIVRFDVHINTNICLFYDTRKIMHGNVNVYNNNWLFACLSLLYENKKKKPIIPMLTFQTPHSKPYPHVVFIQIHTHFRIFHRSL